MQIDEKLKEILPYIKFKGRDDKEHATYVQPTDEAIAEIKAAFQDAGYHPPTQTIVVPAKTDVYHNAYLDTIKKEAGLMTGQEWLDRFNNELGKPTYMDDEDGRHAVYKNEWVAEAVRKASGVE